MNITPSISSNSEQDFSNAEVGLDTIISCNGSLSMTAKEIHMHGAKLTAKGTLKISAAKSISINGDIKSTDKIKISAENFFLRGSVLGAG